MPNEKEEIRLLLSKDFTGACPYCKSHNVEQVPGKFGWKVGGNSSKYPEADTAAWGCQDCKRIFHVKD
jgi:transposase-like protein